MANDLALAEYNEPELGDRRLNARLGRIIAAVAKDPSRSFPEAFEDDSQLEGLYRFLGNEKVSFESLLLPHRTATLERAITAEEVLVVHDTSEFVFHGEQRRHLGRVNGPGGGFLGHFALGVSVADREVLGVMGATVRYRAEKRLPTKSDWRKRWKDPEKLSRRWLDLVEETRDFVDRRAKLIHVLDREGDSFELLANLIIAKDRFVIRGYLDRLLANGNGKIPDALKSLPIVAERDVPLSRRTKHDSVGNAPRERRMATLRISATAVEIAKPAQQKGLPAKLALNIVHVQEHPAPKGMAPVEWRLWTSEPIDTEEQILRIVDHYRARWLIEEFFKSLKTGCAFEKRQLDSRHTVENALALLVPMAWTLLVLRQRGRQDIAAPPPLTPQQIDVLGVVAPKRMQGPLTARTVMLAVAGLGGHLKSNGDPGWQVLGRGLAKLLAYEVGWIAAGSRCDR